MTRSSETRAFDEKSLSKELRFVRAIQVSRALCYTLSIGMGFLFQVVGVHKVDALSVFWVLVLSYGSSFAVYQLARWQTRRGQRFAYDWAWMVSDVLLTTWGVSITGGFASHWYIWYLANSCSAAFVLGSRAAFVVAAGDVVGYFTMLALRGEIGLFDPNFFAATGRMAFLNGAAFFFLKGVGDLKHKRETIKKLVDNETRKVEELTRLTTALDARSKELEEANVKIREADRMKSQFLANMSHELRTPLNSIIGFSEILKGRLKDDIPPKYLKFLENINHSGQHLLGVINDILDLSKIEAGKMEVNPEEISVPGLVDGVCQVMRGVIGSRGIQLDVALGDGVTTIEADPVKLKQILYNLLSNAVKFSPNGSTVRLRARALSREDSILGVPAIEIAVTDQGIGIPAKDQELVFEPFRQADGTSTRKYEGTGLGLSLVKSLLTLHRGRVGLQSAPGLGSTFTITLPRTFSGIRGETDPRLPLPIPGGSRQRVLVIEDDPTAFDLIGSALESGGYIPVRARSGEEAILLARTLRPSAITLDLVLPGCDGWEVLKTLKTEPETASIPVIIVSIMDNRELGVALGADDYMLKPIQREDLLGRLRQLLPEGSTGDGTILLIDDEPSLHDMLDSMLVPLGYRLIHASSGAQGLELCRQSTPSLVILDLMMTGMDGFEVAARLQSDPKSARVPILVLTARDLSIDDRQRLSGKITALVQKSDAIKGRLVGVVEDLLRRRTSP